MCESGTEAELPTVWWWGLNFKSNGEMYNAAEARIFAWELLRFLSCVVSNVDSKATLPGYL